MSAIHTKSEAVALYHADEFGNCLRQWSTLRALQESRFAGLVAIRYRGRAGGGPCFYNVPSHEAAQRVRKSVNEGWEEDRFYFSEMAPDAKIVLQGEYIGDPRFGHCLHYSRVKRPMREALKAEPLNHLGPGALLVMRAAMSPPSWEDFEVLRDRYPDSAIEFSCYSTFLGKVPRRNTIVWEVRNY